MTTLSEQINKDYWDGISKFKQQNYEWLLQQKRYATHSVTLTFDPKKIRSVLRRAELDIPLNAQSLVEEYKKEMRYFSCLLRRSLFGKTAERFHNRLLLIPVLEGLETGKMPHYHCTIGVDAKRLNVADTKIKECWERTRFCGYHNEVKPFRDEGWLGYNNKKTMSINQQAIDWDNVLVPSSSQSTLG